MNESENSDALVKVIFKRGEILSERKCIESTKKYRYFPILTILDDLLRGSDKSKLI
jgi:hypothetical protein